MRVNFLAVMVFFHGQNLFIGSAFLFAIGYSMVFRRNICVLEVESLLFSLHSQLVAHVIKRILICIEAGLKFWEE